MLPQVASNLVSQPTTTMLVVFCDAELAFRAYIPNKPTHSPCEYPVDYEAAKKALPGFSSYLERSANLVNQADCKLWVPGDLSGVLKESCDFLSLAELPVIPLRCRNEIQDAVLFSNNSSS